MTYNQPNQIRTDKAYIMTETPSKPLYDAKALYQILQDKNIPYQLFHHPHVDTVEQALEHTNTLKGFHIKNLFVRDKKRNFYLFTFEFQEIVDLKEIAKTVEAKGNLSFASPDYLYQILGVRPGSVTPFGMLNDKDKKVRFYLDKNAPMDEGLINPHPLRNDCTLQMMGKDLIRLLTDFNIDIHYID